MRRSTRQPTAIAAAAFNTVDRRRFMVGAAALLGGAAIGPVFRAAAQDGSAAPGVGDVPTTGVRRPGPIGPVAPLVARREGVAPDAIRIGKAGVDSAIEPLEIVDGVMQNPTGPWIVGWYPVLGNVGGTGNAVMAGHVDYYNVGKAVFGYVEALVQGDPIEVVGEDGVSYVYLVDWSQNYSVAELDTETIQGIVGETDDENLTLVTCVGTFDYNSGEYDQRLAIRASLVTS